MNISGVLCPTNFSLSFAGPSTSFDEGTDVVAQVDEAPWGAGNQGLRVLRSRADTNALHLLVEGLGGRTYSMVIRTPRRVGAA